jgi:hypothetical protein
MYFDYTSLLKVQNICMDMYYAMIDVYIMISYIIGYE